MSPAAAHAAIVLAAGGSRRLGRPKQLLTRGGETLVHRAARLALETAPRQLLVVLGAEAEAVRAELRGLECEQIVNPDWREGLASSLLIAAASLRDDVDMVLVLGCDQPALEVAHLHALLEGAATMPTHCAAVVHAGGPGIPAVLPRSWFELDAITTLAGDRGFGARLRALPGGTQFRLDMPELRRDIDTSRALADAVARGWIDGPVD